MKRYEPRTPSTKRVLLKAAINNAPAKKPEEIEKNLTNVDEFMKKLRDLARRALTQTEESKVEDEMREKCERIVAEELEEILARTPVERVWTSFEKVREK